MGKKKNGTGLRYIPIDDFNLIPVGLIEQVEPPVARPDLLYTMSHQIVANPLNVLGVFADAEKQVKGFLWGTINPITSCLHIHILSIDPEHQGKGIVKEATNIVNKIKDTLNQKAEKFKIENIKFLTSMPEKFESAGWKKTNVIQMES